MSASSGRTAATAAAAAAPLHDLASKPYWVDEAAIAESNIPTAGPLYLAGDHDSGCGYGPFKPLSVYTLAEAMEEARAIAREDAMMSAMVNRETAVQEWYVFVDDGSGELVHEADGAERAEPDEPECADDIGHDWCNPGPANAARREPHDGGSGATVARTCRVCGTVREVRTFQADLQGNCYDSVSYRQGPLW